MDTTVARTLPGALGTAGGGAGDAGVLDDEAAPGGRDGEEALSGPRWVGWRARLLVAAALAGCVALFLLARAVAGLPSIEARWSANEAGQLVLAASDDPALRPLVGRALIGVIGGSATVSVPDALLLERSTRWIIGDADRQRHASAQRQLAQALAAPSARLFFADGALVEVHPSPLGAAGLGAMYWLFCAAALALYLVAMTALLARPEARSLLYALVAFCQCGNLVFIAVEQALPLALPASFASLELLARSGFDLVSAAALVQAITLHPTRLPGARFFAGLAWAVCLGLLALVASGTLAHGWWLTQLATLGCGALAIGLLTWSYRIEPHPFAVMLRRFGSIAVGTLALLTAALAATDRASGLQPAIAAIGPVLWTAFFTSLLLLVPFLSRSQQLMREFSLLAAVSTIATALDLLFVAVFSLGAFASLTLALFVAFGVYAGARQWILNQLLGNRMLTAERMFEQLYRVARDVEAQPQSAASHLSRLLRDLFEPLEMRAAPSRRGTRARILSSGSTLVVPVPDLGQPDAQAAGSIAIRYAHRGRRLFTLDDARLADRMVEQLRRAVAYDKAVEQGRNEERARLAQDLHDDIGARLLTLMYKASTPEMEDYVRHTLQDLKTLTRGLAAPSHRLSHAAPEWKADIAQRLAVAHIELAWSFSFDEDVLLSVVQWSGLTRVLRELVSNAIAHAEASRVAIDFHLEADRLDLTVSDDGRGRRPREWAHGLGLGGVRKRVKQLGGEVEWLELPLGGIACKVRIEGLSLRR